jgi:hypothetical protein
MTSEHHRSITTAEFTGDTLQPPPRLTAKHLVHRYLTDVAKDTSVPVPPAVSPLFAEIVESDSRLVKLLRLDDETIRQMRQPDQLLGFDPDM